MNKIKVFLVDDHIALRDGLELLINAQDDMHVVGKAGDGRTALDQIATVVPDVVIMDVSLPGMNGAQTTAMLMQTYTHIRVLGLTRHSEVGYVRQLFRAGAQGYVLKQAATEDLVAAIRSVAAGRTYIDPAIASDVVQPLIGITTGSDGHHNDLSEREREVVQQVAYGYSNKEIATQMGLSVKTVDTYKARAMEKLGLYNRAALVRYALQRGWISQDSE